MHIHTGDNSLPTKIYEKVLGQRLFPHPFKIIGVWSLLPPSPIRICYGVYISQLIRFASVYSNVDYLNNRNNFCLQSYRYHKRRTEFSLILLQTLRVDC